jgi:hypothetical protein
MLEASRFKYRKDRLMNLIKDCPGWRVSLGSRFLRNATDRTDVFKPVRTGVASFGRAV